MILTGVVPCSVGKEDEKLTILQGAEGEDIWSDQNVLGMSELFGRCLSLSATSYK